MSDRVDSGLYYLIILYGFVFFFFHFLSDSGMFLIYYCNAILYILCLNAHCQIIAPHYSELGSYEKSLLNKYSNPQIQDTLL